RRGTGAAGRARGRPARGPQPVPPPAVATGIDPRLEAALAELALEEVRLNRLTLRAGDGDHDALQLMYVEALDQLPRSVVEEFDEVHGITTRTIYEMLVTWKAH